MSLYDCNCHTATSISYLSAIGQYGDPVGALEEVMLYALKVGSLLDWENAPDEFKADLAAPDRLEVPHP